MTKYTEIKNSNDITVIIKNNDDGSVTSFLQDPANTDYQEYLKYLEDNK
jgi:hypothetical protein